MERKPSKKRSIKKSAKSKTKEDKHKEDKHKEDKHEEEEKVKVEEKVEADTHVTESSEQNGHAENGNGPLKVQGKTITQAERDEIRAAYNILSKDNNGKMGMKEVQKLLQSQFMTFTDNQAIDVFRKLDQDGNGEIDFEEFEKYVIENNLIKPSQEEFGADMKEAFAMFDTDNNGYIDAEEFKALMMMLGDKMDDDEISEMMKEADTNGDGQIDYAEFCSHMSKAL